MKNTLIMTLLCALFGTSGLLAQTTHRDSIIMIAKKDAKASRLSAAEREKFKKDKTNYSSDLFKPNPGLVSDTTLLKDSVYVKTFRSAAYKKAINRRTTGHYVLLGLGGYSAIIIIGTIVTFLVILHDFH